MLQLIRVELLISRKFYTFKLILGSATGNAKFWEVLREVLHLQGRALSISCSIDAVMSAPASPGKPYLQRADRRGTKSAPAGPVDDNTNMEDPKSPSPSKKSTTPSPNKPGEQSKAPSPLPRVSPRTTRIVVYVCCISSLHACGLVHRYNFEVHVVPIQLHALHMN